VLSAPPAANLTNPIKARFEATGRIQGNEVLVSRSLRMPIGRVTPEDYRAFAEYCRAVDLAEAVELVVQLP
jgi:hypothetical protein